MIDTSSKASLPPVFPPQAVHSNSMRQDGEQSRPITEAAEKSSSPDANMDPEDLTRDESSLGSQDEAPPKVDTLYTLYWRDSDTDQTKTFYRDTPFGGVDLKLSDSTEHRDEDNGAAIYACAGITSQDLSHKEGNTDRDWWRSPANFNFGEEVKLETVLYRFIRINSARLRNVLESIIDYDPQLLAAGLGEHDFSSPAGCYTTLMLHFEDLHRLYHRLSACDTSQQSSTLDGLPANEEIRMSQVWDEFARPEPTCTWSDETRTELAALLRLLEPHYHSTVTPILRKLLLDQPRIRFEDLWLLYKPGTIVYKGKSDQLQGLVVCAARRMEKLLSPNSEGIDRLTRYEIEAWYFEYDGKLLRRTRTLQNIIQYEGDRSLMVLPLIPAKIYDKTDGGAGRKRLRAMGQKLLQIVTEGFAHRDFEHPRTLYRGQIVIDAAEFNARLSREWEAYRRNRYDIESEMFEFDREETFLQASDYLEDVEPADGRGYKRFSEYHELDPTQPEDVQKLFPDGIIVLSNRIGGFALSTKRWMRFNVEGISDGPPFRHQNQLKERLLINDDDREILQTVFGKRAPKHAVQADFVPGKGEGQVFLLHGPPGTGKTLTAECVANDTQRPLISLNPADLGDVTYVRWGRVSLREWFILAARWGAILLIDEADVFLERRSSNESHNTIVTVFLRTMEYYSGILFLTTNRPGKIDDAFISRITAAIQYPALTKDARYGIWQKFFDLHEKSSQMKVKVTHKAKKELRENDAALNGREIRNIFQTAISLAIVERQNQSEGQECAEDCGPQVVWLDWDHFSKALERHRSFLDYLTTLHGNKDEHLRNRMNRIY